MVKTLLILFIIVLLQPNIAHGASPVPFIPDYLRFADHEIVLVYNASGRQIARFDGGLFNTTVRIDYPQPWRNGSMLHNHVRPALSSLSLPDLNTARIGNLLSSTVISVDGKICRAQRLGAYWLKMPTGVLQAQVHILIDYKPWPQQEALFEQFIIGLSHQYHFQYGCYYG